MLIKFELVKKQIELLEKINTEIIELSKGQKDLPDNWQELLMSPAHVKAKPYVQAIYGLNFMRCKFGNSKELDMLIEGALLVNPLFLNQRDRFEDTHTALNWFRTPHWDLKDIPWTIIHTAWGRKKVGWAIAFDYRNAEYLAAMEAGCHIVLASRKGVRKDFKGIGLEGQALTEYVIVKRR